ncbi:MAG TPA: ribonuclease HII [Candidatus Kapabacteria bacterium]|jgi:ribonuclease HII|nr:ribonuclease HII [Candidatus Kapabacteria bacterium]
MDQAAPSLIVDVHRLEIQALGFGLVAGVDEAGRGALAGPVVAAAVILPDECDIPGVRDSKLVPEPEREELYELIVARALGWSVGIVSEQVIDEINILQATFVAMRQAVGALSPRAEYVLIDGRDAVEVGIPCRAIIDGDALCPTIAAASIIAKVTRDRIMRSLGEVMPQFGFARNKGYATAAHREAILEHGPAHVHRRTFLRRLLETPSVPTGGHDDALYTTVQPS